MTITEFNKEGKILDKSAIKITPEMQELLDRIWSIQESKAERSA